MPGLFDQIRSAVADEKYLVSWHADERAEERGITVWQLVSGLDNAVLVEERPSDRPNPTVLVRERLADGSEVRVVWSWLRRSRRAQLVTVYW